ncbi:MAG TPA: ATP-binding protein [Ktedonobacteraceae bacterium]|nr:ATP-binding protein [Ktedonobacteraceae bacterium]
MFLGKWRWSTLLLALQWMTKIANNGSTLPQTTPHFDQNRYQMAMEAAGVGMYDFDIVRKQHFWSKECKALLGLPPDAEEDFTFFRSLIHPEDRERVLFLFAEHHHMKTPHKIEYRLVWPDGTIHWIVDHGRFLYDQQGNPIRLLGVAWEITALKQAEEARSQANEQLREFFCQIGHELRTPLTALKGNLQLSERHLRRWLAAHENSLAEKEKLLLQRLKRWNEQALRQANVENHLIENLLDVSALQAAGLCISLEPRNLVQVVSAAVDDLQTIMPPCTLFCETCEPSDIPVMVDEVRIGQVITQYIKNALHAAAERPPIIVGISLEEKVARVWVKDTGPGLSCEQQVSIWKLLQSASGLTGSQCPGGNRLGLGLYLCRELIRLHRGQIGVESVPGEGSTFWFTLPLRELQP